MAFWVLQILFDVVLMVAVGLALNYRRRVHLLEAQLDRTLRLIQDLREAAVSPSAAHNDAALHGAGVGLGGSGSSDASAPGPTSSATKGSASASVSGSALASTFAAALNPSAATSQSAALPTALATTLATAQPTALAAAIAGASISKFRGSSNVEFDAGPAAASNRAPFTPAQPATHTTRLGVAADSRAGQASRTVLERRDMPERPDRRNDRPSPESYDRAEQLLARGTDPREVSRQTGLSQAELQLIGKVSNRTQ